jgi:chloride channel 7
MTLTTTVMVMETTGAMQLIVPLMITVFVAKVGLNRGTWESCR